VGRFQQTETCRAFLLRAFARANYIDVNTTRKNGQTDDRIAVGDPWSVVFDWLNKDI
jgi:superfamily I DNA/RNA helicase